MSSDHDPSYGHQNELERLREVVGRLVLELPRLLNHGQVVIERRTEEGAVVRDAYSPYLSRPQAHAALLVAAASEHPAAAFVEHLAAQEQHNQACQAVRALASSISAHGGAIERREVADVLQSVLLHLTERTRWAVRSQLKGTGMLPG